MVWLIDCIPGCKPIISTSLLILGALIVKEIIMQSSWKRNTRIVRASDTYYHLCSVISNMVHASNSHLNSHIILTRFWRKVVYSYKSRINVVLTKFDTYKVSLHKFLLRFYLTLKSMNFIMKYPSSKWRAWKGLAHIKVHDF